MKKYRPIDLSAVKTYPIAGRDNKVNVRDHFASPLRAGMSGVEFIDALPRLLGADNLRGVADAIVRARHKGRPVVLAIGGHVIKCGLQPVLKGLIEADVITAVAMNGSAAIHDFEVSLVGATSEDVGAVLHSGDFGFAEETGGGINRALKEAVRTEIGYGEALGRQILKDRHPFRDYSLLAACVEKEIPVTVHVAVGTDIIHQHPEARRGGDRRDDAFAISACSPRWSPTWGTAGCGSMSARRFCCRKSFSRHCPSPRTWATTSTISPPPIST